MNTKFKLDNIEVTIKNYNSNFEIYINDECKTFYYDGCLDCSTQENVENAY